MNIELRVRKFTEAEKAEIRGYYNSGYTCGQIAKRFMASRNRIYYEVDHDGYRKKRSVIAKEFMKRSGYKYSVENQREANTRRRARVKRDKTHE